MKNKAFLSILFFLGIVLASCGKAQAGTPDPGEGEIANWAAWRFTWKGAQTYYDVTVKVGEAQATYVPESENSDFLAVTTEIANISKETQEIRFPQGPIYLTDRDQNTYDLVGIAKGDTILMAPPYLLVEDTVFRTTKWDTGFFTLAYQPTQGTWFIQASAGASFQMDFLFVVPRDITRFVLHYGNGMIVNIQ